MSTHPDRINHEVWHRERADRLERDLTRARKEAAAWHAAYDKAVEQRDRARTTAASFAEALWQERGNV